MAAGTAAGPNPNAPQRQGQIIQNNEWDSTVTGTTPSGSTAYNLSNGGPVLAWGLDALTDILGAGHVPVGETRADGLRATIETYLQTELTVTALASVNRSWTPKCSQ